VTSALSGQTACLSVRLTGWCNGSAANFTHHGYSSGTQQYQIKARRALQHLCNTALCCFVLQSPFSKVTLGPWTPLWITRGRIWADCPPSSLSYWLWRCGGRNTLLWVIFRVYCLWLATKSLHQLRAAGFRIERMCLHFSCEPVPVCAGSVGGAQLLGLPICAAAALQCLPHAALLSVLGTAFSNSEC